MVSCCPTGFMLFLVSSPLKLSQVGVPWGSAYKRYIYIYDIIIPLDGLLLGLLLLLLLLLRAAAVVVSGVPPGFPPGGRLLTSGVSGVPCGWRKF